jgi:enoyl-CoA hydratase/carnithine racemase
MGEPILTAVADGVLTITFNRPDALNALNRSLMEATRAALAAAAADENARAHCHRRGARILRGRRPDGAAGGQTRLARARHL